MTGWQRTAWWSLAVAGAVAAVALTVLAVVGDLGTADQLGSVAGSVAGLISLAVSVYALVRTPATAPAARVAAQGGSNAAGGSIRNAAAHDSAPTPPAPSQPGGGISASGGSNAAGGDIEGTTAHRGP
ncbi:hypothetical protein [Streptomyces pinistramenti]|uniref:hypothetical protein n=1 Tax=Streptomyces pinistramenti TaxID=2884812 RepID=UPI001D0918F2|nr:hypothetical protein [Streptomyces pinistramenti]MCB5910043.1 hypothetical protein [Streptomyces pinistramenti]